MARELKDTGTGNLFIVSDITIKPVGAGEIQVMIKGVDIFRPQTWRDRVRRA